MTKRETVPLATQISRVHRQRLDDLKRSGFNINAVIEQGVDLVYDQMQKAGLIKNGAICDDCGSATISQ